MAVGERLRPRPGAAGGAAPSVPRSPSPGTARWAEAEPRLLRDRGVLAGPPGFGLPGAVPERRPAAAFPGRARGFLRGGCDRCRPGSAPVSSRPAAGMINAILVFNNHGKPRLVRFYQHLVRGRGHRWGSAGALGRPRLAGVIVVGLGSPACLSPAPRPSPSGCPMAGSPVAAPAAAPVVPGLAGSWHLPVTWSCRLTVSLGVAGGEQGMWVLQAVHPWVFALAFLQAEEVQQQIIRETFHLVLKRDDHICNFLECGR